MLNVNAHPSNMSSECCLAIYIEDLKDKHRHFFFFDSFGIYSAEINNLDALYTVDKLVRV